MTSASTRPRALASTRRRVLGVLVAVLAIVAIALTAFFVWPALRPTDSSTTDPSGTGVSWPAIVTEDELRTFGAANGPVYWAGPKDGVEYELTITESGTFYVRYLTDGAAAGDTSNDFLSVATYPNIDGYDNLVQAGAQDDAASTLTDSGALIVTTSAAPLSTYFSFEGMGFQVEVYSPDSGGSLALVEDGTVEVLK